MNAQYEELFVRVEAAIDAHPTLRRGMREGVDVTNPTFTVDRDGYTLTVTVSLEGRTKTHKITGIGETAQEAASDLIGGLEHWAAVLK